MLEVRVHLDLVHGRHHRRLCEQVLQMFSHEVAHANRAYLAFSKELLQGAIRVERKIKAAGQRLVEEQEVEAVDSQFRDALLERV